MKSTLGFHSLHDEQQRSLAVDGSLPQWLTGTLIRNGPGTFSNGEGNSVDHWFDGLAMCYRFTFDPGNNADASIGTYDAVHYQNRFLETDAYEAAQAGEFNGGFATGETTLRDRLKGLFTAPYDNTNIIVERVNGRYLALTESPRAVEIDPTTLSVTGEVQYDGSQPTGQLACAHLKRDPATGVLFNIETEFGRTSTYHIHSISGANDRRHIASVETDAPAYMHSFALTPRYVVLTEFPFRINPLRFFKPGRQGPFIEQFDWQPDRGTRIIVVDRTTGETIAEPVTDAVFGFHHVNAFERDGGSEIVFDLETIPDTTAITELSLDRLREGNLEAIAGRLERFRVNLGDTTGTARYDTTAATASREMLYDDGTALPTVSPAQWCRSHRYVYSMSLDQPATEWATGILKYDTQTDEVVEYNSGGDYFGEPIVVPRPNGPAEAGVVLTVALDVDAGRSRLLVCDTEDLAERARITLPHATPFDFHGRYFPEIRVRQAN